LFLDVSFTILNEVPMTVKINSGDWVVVCDGRKAMILENKGDEKFPNLRVQNVQEHDNPETSEQGADAPGRIHKSFGTARSAVGQTDWHDEAEQAFLHSLLHQLEGALAAGKTKSLIVVAAPRALGMLRKSYTPGLRRTIKAEIGKDYVKLPVDQIEKHVLNDLGTQAAS
jgi:protein required for attachment to host cells